MGVTQGVYGGGGRDRGFPRTGGIPGQGEHGGPTRGVWEGLGQGAGGSPGQGGHGGIPRAGCRGVLGQGVWRVPRTGCWGGGSRCRADTAESRAPTWVSQTLVVMICSRSCCGESGAGYSGGLAAGPPPSPGDGGAEPRATHHADELRQRHHQLHGHQLGAVGRRPDQLVVARGVQQILHQPLLRVGAQAPWGAAGG